MKFLGIYLRAISRQILKIPINKMGFKKYASEIPAWSPRGQWACWVRTSKLLQKDIYFKWFYSELRDLKRLVLRPEHSQGTSSIPWLVMAWPFGAPGYQQPWYWLTKIGVWSYLRNNFNHLIHFSMEEWWKFWLNAVGCHYNVIQYGKILHKQLNKLRQNINQMVDPQKIPNTLP